MRTAFAFLILIHGLIHVMGFAKAFQLAKIDKLSQSISKPMGMVWLLSVLLFLTVIVLFFLKKDWWSIIAIVAVIISQLLIIIYWKDAKFGTIANIMIVIPAIISLAAYNFENSYEDDVENALKTSNYTDEIITLQDINALPPIIQKYLNYVGVLGKPKVNNMKITFEGTMRDKGKEWFAFTSEQYNFLDPRKRLFFMKAKVKGLSTYGYHVYDRVGASILIKLLSIYPVVNLEGDELYPTETVTYFNDLCLFAPSTLIDKRIHWETRDSLSIKATFTNNKTSISAILYFNEEGQLVNFTSNDRYSISEMKTFPFYTPVKKYKNIHGYNLPTYGEATWRYPDGEFVYGKFNLKSIEYNILSKN